MAKIQLPRLLILMFMLNQSGIFCNADVRVFSVDGKFLLINLIPAAAPLKPGTWDFGDGLGSSAQNLPTFIILQIHLRLH